MCMFLGSTLNAQARTEFVLSIPLISSAPVYTPSYPVYTQPIQNPRMCWDEYYGQWAPCQRMAPPAPVYAQPVYAPMPFLIYNSGSSYYRNDGYRHNNHNYNNYNNHNNNYNNRNYNNNNNHNRR